MSNFVEEYDRANKDEKRFLAWPQKDGTWFTQVRVELEAVKDPALHKRLADEKAVGNAIRIWDSVCVRTRPVGDDVCILPEWPGEASHVRRDGDDAKETTCACGLKQLTSFEELDSSLLTVEEAIEVHWKDIKTPSLIVALSRYVHGLMKDVAKEKAISAAKAVADSISHSHPDFTQGNTKKGDGFVCTMGGGLFYVFSRNQPSDEEAVSLGLYLRQYIRDACVSPEVVGVWRVGNNLVERLD